MFTQRTRALRNALWCSGVVALVHCGPVDNETPGEENGEGNSGRGGSAPSWKEMPTGGSSSSSGGALSQPDFPAPVAGGAEPDTAQEDAGISKMPLMGGLPASEFHQKRALAHPTLCANANVSTQPFGTSSPVTSDPWPGVTLTDRIAVTGPGWLVSLPDSQPVVYEYSRRHEVSVSSDGNLLVESGAKLLMFPSCVSSSIASPSQRWATRSWWTVRTLNRTPQGLSLSARAPSSLIWRGCC